MKLLLVLAFALIAAGCAHNHSIDGDTAKGLNPAGLKVGIGSPEVKVGDSVVFKLERCVSSGSSSEAGPFENCKTKVLGRAKVLKVLDKDSSIVARDGKLGLSSDVRVEKETL